MFGIPPIVLITIGAGVGGFLGKQLWASVRSWKDRVDAHLRDCAEKEAVEAILAYDVSTMKSTVKDMSVTMKEMGQSINENHLEVMNQLLTIARDEVK